MSKTTVPGTRPDEIARLAGLSREVRFRGCQGSTPATLARVLRTVAREPHRWIADHYPGAGGGVLYVSRTAKPATTTQRGTRR